MQLGIYCMKKLKTVLFIFVHLCIVLPWLYSCTNDWDENAPLLAIGTVKVIADQDYYFALDEGSKLYPGDTSNIQGYQVIAGQRAFVYFTPLEENLPGYEYNAKIMHIENILTKDIYIMPTEKSDSIGNDPINAVEAWIAEGYLNIKYQFYHSNNQEKKHMLNLVVNEEITSENTRPDYFLLEFRHNAYEDAQLEPGTGVVSFKLDNIKDSIKDKKGINIRVKSLHDGIVYIPVEISK